MSLVLYAQAAPPDRLCLWVGAFNRLNPPVLTWRFREGHVDSRPLQPAMPNALRPIASVRRDAKHIIPNKQARAFAGIYEFAGLQPNTRYTVEVTDDSNQRAQLRTHTLPKAVPEASGETFNVLLVSCFHSETDKGGLAGQIVKNLPQLSRPHLTLLLGDQVYLDLPTEQDFPDDPAWLADKFEHDYVANWQATQDPQTGYTNVLAIAPYVCIPDDHEYWNNFPHTSPFIGNTREPSGRNNWREAARTIYEGFQQSWYKYINTPTPPTPLRLGEAVELDMPPLSFLLADTRTFRKENFTGALASASAGEPDALQQLRDWVQRISAANQPSGGDRWLGVIATGQSLFGEPAKGLGDRFSRAVGDYELADYGDYDKIIRELVTPSAKGRPLLCLTGDVHWGRVMAARELNLVSGGRDIIYEIISSPASLVKNILSDRPRSLWASISGVFGSKNPWPRHDDPATPPEFFAPQVLGRKFQCGQTPPTQTQNPFAFGLNEHPLPYLHKGNHVTLLTFRRNAGGLELRITYWPLTTTSGFTQPQQVKPLSLTVNV